MSCIFKKLVYTNKYFRIILPVRHFNASRIFFKARFTRKVKISASQDIQQNLSFSPHISISLISFTFYRIILGLLVREKISSQQKTFLKGNKTKALDETLANFYGDDTFRRRHDVSRKLVPNNASPIFKMKIGLLYSLKVEFKVVPYDFLTILPV